VCVCVCVCVEGKGGEYFEWLTLGVKVHAIQDNVDPFVTG
jgi:hypothetical protein